jgi:hypothetical protein
MRVRGQATVHITTYLIMVNLYKVSKPLLGKSLLGITIKVNLTSLLGRGGYNT